MICVVNFANDNYRQQQKYCTDTAYRFGKVDKVIEYSEKDLPESFFSDNPEVTSYKRGFGLWLWKPYIILMAMNGLCDGDTLIYADSGMTFINDVRNLTPILDNSKNQMAFFELPLLNEDWTKGETFRWAGYFPNEDERQITGNFFLMKVSEKSKKFIFEWYELCRQEKLISPQRFDFSITNGNYFRAHREDQSLLSILVRKKGLSVYPDPSDYGEFQFMQGSFGRCRYWEKESRSYPTIILCNRKVQGRKYLRNYRIKKIMNWLGLYNCKTVNLKLKVLKLLK